MKMDEPISVCDYFDELKIVFVGNFKHLSRGLFVKRDYLRIGLMTGGKDINEITGKDEKDAGSRARSFVETLKSGAYAKIDVRYFQLLWKALEKSPKKKLSSAVKDDFFACLARGGGQMELIRQCAKEGKFFSLDSPFAKVFFNLFGNRAGNGGAE